MLLVLIAMETEEVNVSESELNARQQFLDDITSFLFKCQEDVMDVLNELEWTPDHFIKQRKLVQCPHDPGHTMPANKLEEHKNQCQLKKQGIPKEDIERILDNSDFFYEKATCVHSVKLDKEILNSALWNYHVKNHSVYYGYEKMPLTADQESCMLSREDRLGLAEFVITKARQANRLKQLEKDELLASANLADLINEGEKEERPLDFIEELAAMRDYKRRRQSYRSKNVHITRKSHTEIMREVITNQMEMYAQSLKDPTSEDITSATEQASTSLSNIAERKIDRNSEDIEKRRSESKDRYDSDQVRNRSRTRDGIRDREKDEDSYRKDRDRQKKDRDENAHKDRASSKRRRSKSPTQSRSCSRTRDRSESTDRGGHSKKRHKKHKHKHKKKKSSYQSESD